MTGLRADGQMHRAGVAGGDVAELSGGGVQNPVDHRGELLGRRVERKELVQTVGDLGGRRDVEPIRASLPRIKIDDGSDGGEKRRESVTDSRADATPWPLTSRMYSPTLPSPSGMMFSPSPASSSHG